MAYRVMIVDDSPTMRAVIKKTIKASGFNVDDFYEADDGKDALDLLQKEWLDLIITDYNMPNMNGMELLEKVKQDDSLSSIPVVFISTEGSEQRIKEFMDKGAADYIKKPFTPEILKSKLNLIMGEPENGSGENDQDNEGLDF
jgi:two-component system chemotaxis response regulator CheY